MKGFPVTYKLVFPVTSRGYKSFKPFFDCGCKYSSSSKSNVSSSGYCLDMVR